MLSISDVDTYGHKLRENVTPTLNYRKRFYVPWNSIDITQLRTIMKQKLITFMKSYELSNFIRWVSFLFYLHPGDEFQFIKLINITEEKLYPRLVNTWNIYFMIKFIKITWSDNRNNKVCIYVYIVINNIIKI